MQCSRETYLKAFKTEALVTLRQTGEQILGLGDSQFRPVSQRGGQRVQDTLRKNATNVTSPAFAQSAVSAST